ncbi:MAG TPA: tetratricopeptide repeat protein [Fontimonas sp.]
MVRSALALALVLLLCACASAPRGAGGAEALSVDRELYADLIRGMLDEGQYYAALAHIQQRQRNGGGDAELLRYFEGEARRGLNQIPEAHALYAGLLKSKLAAQAYHGLGLLHAGTDIRRAVAYLQEAATRAPTDAEIRNDLGYALMRAGAYDAALAELATAAELSPGSDKARNNLVLLLMLRQDEAGVQRMAREAAIPPETLQRLRQQARTLMSSNAQARP